MTEQMKICSMLRKLKCLKKMHSCLLELVALGNILGLLITCNRQEKILSKFALVDMYIIEADRTVGTFNTSVRLSDNNATISCIATPSFELVKIKRIKPLRLIHVPFFALAISKLYLHVPRYTFIILS